MASMIAAATVGISLLAGGCSTSSGGSGTLGPVAATTPASVATSNTTTPATPAKSTGSRNQTGTGWPASEDCVSYDPSTLTVSFNAGIFRVTDGSHEVLTVSGQDGDTVGQQALALARRYRKHCFIGRDNGRPEPNAYIFDYWRNPSGQAPVIPGLDDLCSDYNPLNLTVEDMGSSDGWRVKDHDHVLALFDTEGEARDGALVLKRYDRACTIGNGDEDPRLISFFIS